MCKKTRLDSGQTALRFLSREHANKSMAAQRIIKHANARQALQPMAVALSKKPNAADVCFMARPLGLTAK